MDSHSRILLGRGIGVENGVGGGERVGIAAEKVCLRHRAAIRGCSNFI